MNIGKVAVETNISAKMIRYYEDIGLLINIARTDGGYRNYRHNDIQTLHFIHRARNLGFSILEIKDLLALWRDKARSSEDVKKLTQQHIKDLEQKAQSLQTMANTLKSLVKCCHGDERPDCPIIEELAARQ